jgi:hypothetical protein
MTAPAEGAEGAGSAEEVAVAELGAASAEAGSGVAAFDAGGCSLALGASTGDALTGGGGLSVAGIALLEAGGGAGRADAGALTDATAGSAEAAEALAAGCSGAEASRPSGMGSAKAIDESAESPIAMATPLRRDARTASGYGKRAAGPSAKQPSRLRARKPWTLKGYRGIGIGRIRLGFFERVSSMAASGPPSFYDFEQIPDPARHAASRPMPPPVVPSEPSPTRGTRLRRQQGALALGAGWLLLAPALTGLRHDLLGPDVLLPLSLWCVTGALAVLLVVRPRARGLPLGRRGTQLALAFVGSLFLGSVLVTWAASTEVPLTWDTIRPCLLIASLFASGLLVLAASLLYRSFTALPAWRGAVIGASLGLLGTTTAHLHCAVRAGSHVLVAHGGSIALGAAIGAALGALRGRI